MDFRLVGRDTQGLILAVVGLTASELHRAVLATPSNASLTRDAMADVVSNAIFTSTSILTGMVFTFIDIYGTFYT